MKRYLSLALLVVLIVVPASVGQFGSEDALCESGRSLVGTVLFIETGLMLVGAMALKFVSERVGSIGQALNSEIWNILGVIVLIAIPFFVAMQTDSSVCSRGRAFFWQSIIIEAMILAIVAVSYNLLFGFTGVVSFGHAAFFGFGAYLVGIFTASFGVPWALAIVLTLVIGVLVALLKGWVGLRIKGLYFALFTLAFAEVFFLLAGNRLLVDYTGAEDGFTYEVPEMLNTTTNRLFYYYLVLAIFVVCYLVVRRLMHSPTGRALAAIRENEDRAAMLGFNTFRFKLVAIAISGFMATGAGILRGIANKGASPNLLGVGVTVDALLQTIIGGAGTFLGPVVGAFGLHLLEDMLRDTVITLGSVEVDIGQYWALILGIVFIVGVLVFPQGIVGTWQQRRLSTLDGWLRWLRIRR